MTTCSSAGPSGPDMFFTPGGITKFIEAETRIGLGDNDAERSGFENAARVNRKLLWNRFGRITTRHLEHTRGSPAAQRAVEQMEQEFPAEFAKTAASTLPGRGQHLRDQLVLPLLRAAHRAAP